MKQGTPNTGLLARSAAPVFTLFLIASACGLPFVGDEATSVDYRLEEPVPALDSSLRTDLDDETLSFDTGPFAPALDSYVPIEGPGEAVGRPGYTRYVYTKSAGRVIPSLVEGPRGAQIRCQLVELPCSVVELSTLLASGDPIPPQLVLTRSELIDLVAELSAVEDALGAYTDPNSACEAGYEPDQLQTANMGSHFVNNSLIDAVFDPSKPEMLLYARRDGVAPNPGPLGFCDGDVWVGQDIEIVGAAFLIPRRYVGDDHFSGFTGHLDNWHVHYNLCRLEEQDITVDPSVCTGTTTVGPPGQPQGNASDLWMIHAWAAPGFDNQLGAFSMWNPTIWPTNDPTALEANGPEAFTEGANLIADFELPDIVLDEPGTLPFFNADGEAHTVTAGDAGNPLGTFDSGVIAGRQVAEITIDEPGTYSYFCVIHPNMQATITVGQRSSAS